MCNSNCSLFSLLVVSCLVSFLSSQSIDNKPGQFHSVHPASQSWPQQQYPQASQLTRAQRPMVNYAPKYVTTQPTVPKVITGHRKIYDVQNNKEIFHHSYYSDGNKNHEVRSWTNTHQFAPLVSRALSSSYVPPTMNQPPARTVSHNSPVQLQPVPNTNIYYQSPRNIDHQQERSTRRMDTSNEISNPIVSKQSSINYINHPSNNFNIDSLVSYIKSQAFLNRVDALGSQTLFKSLVVNDHAKADEKIIRRNIESTGLNFTINDDCKPKLTTIKFGVIDEPNVIYNPPSVEILRCPQACFSWQFDCMPTNRVASNFTVAVYKTANEKVTREIELYTIESHSSCACACQSFASCFGNSEFSGQRLPNTR
ncbi:uncharacterized protein LOC128398159 [Panonychus citri]|uniref:uncharacterized protein LOC128398159 n=1 Tax=Panonychus citri TaxID=50023 RepID=UPI002307B46E|nr:uncharacterized protein LOC128398159 [Panonychus citri]